MRPAIAKRVRQLVAKRAKYSYEYCKVHEGDSYLPFRANASNC